MKSSLEKIVSHPAIALLLEHIASGAPMVIEDESGKALFKGELGRKSSRHPISASGCTIGWVVGNAKAETVASFISYLTSCQDEKKELAREALNKYREITLLYDISEKVGSCLEPVEAARLVISEARNVIKSSSASVMLYDKDAGCLKVIAASGKSTPSDVAITPGTGIAGSVFEKGQPEIVNNVASDSRYIRGKSKSCSMICVPLKVKDRVIGIINLSSDEVFEYTAADLKLLTALASQAAAIIENARLYSELKKMHDAALDENREIKSYISSKFSFQNIVTSSRTMQEALQLAEKVAKKPFATVYICGENGTGKEVLAKAIHINSGLMENRFVAVNCAAIPAHLLESELFGHVKGAFTGADRDRAGKFDAAQKGTLLLDEIGDMPLDLQTKLLRVLQERCYQRVGSNNTIKTEFRVIATTHRDLKAMVRDGQFREDLYHRLSMFPITIPPLRERKEDIPLLVDYFLEQFQGEVGKPLPGISKAAMDALTAYDWPGNVRELRNCLERATILTDGKIITPGDLGIGVGGKRSMSAAGKEVCLEIRLDADDFSLDAAINQILQTTLDRCNGNKTDAAKLLKVDRKLFYRRMN